MAISHIGPSFRSIVSQLLHSHAFPHRLHLLSSEEKGAALSVFKDGQKVVDIWGGYADIQAWQPWKKSTVANTFALHNVVMSLCLGLLYER